MTMLTVCINLHAGHSDTKWSSFIDVDVAQCILIFDIQKLRLHTVVVGYSGALHAFTVAIGQWTVGIDI